MTDKSANSATQGRLAGVVIALTGVFWAIGIFVGGQLGWSNRMMALVDMMALAGFAFGLVVTYRIWRARQADKG